MQRLTVDVRALTTGKSTGAQPIRYSTPPQTVSNSLTGSWAASSRALKDIDGPGGQQCYRSEGNQSLKHH
jgi:hypothetical protein